MLRAKISSFADGQGGPWVESLRGKWAIRPIDDSVLGNGVALGSDDVCEFRIGGSERGDERPHRSVDLFHEVTVSPSTRKGQPRVTQMQHFLGDPDVDCYAIQFGNLYRDRRAEEVFHDNVVGIETFQKEVAEIATVNEERLKGRVGLPSLVLVEPKRVESVGRLRSHPPLIG